LDKAKQVELLKQKLDEIPYLRALHFKNGEFAAWKNKVCQMLESDYGKESAQELGQEQEYGRQLDCYEEVLKSLIN